MEQINLYAAGIDIGSENHYVAVPEGLDDEPIRCFSCFTSDLEKLADWLVQIGIQTVAMESTGIYWIPLFEILEERGLEVLLVNARHVKNVSGRKTDVLDCQWLQQLHTYGLLSGAFRPAEEITALRAYMRQRGTLVRYAGSHIQHMQKALRQMNLLLDNVVTDITGKTGMTIIRAIISGERDPGVLAAYRDARCKKSSHEIAQSLKGHYREEHLFALCQSVELYDTYQAKIIACDKAIEQQFSHFDTQGDQDQLPSSKKKSATKSTPAFDVRGEMYRMCGVDLTAIDGISDITALKVIAETGTDMNRWNSEKHFSSWMGLSPGNKISGGKVLSSKTKPTTNRAATALRMAAFTLSNSKSALGAYYRRMRSRHGAPKAITATAHKLARLIYSMLKHGTKYVDRGQDYYEQQYQGRVMKNLKRRAAEMGFSLVPSAETNDLMPQISTT
ncbi:MAG: IS110 family transposase [Gammaproteobacteria bacterium]|nr:IS110 family transposase [Gammaproteobacteria bacterium]